MIDLVYCVCTEINVEITGMTYNITKNKITDTTIIIFSLVLVFPGFNANWAIA